MTRRTKRKGTSAPARTGRLIHFFRFGFINYIGARCLLRGRLPLQGAILASTAVEKYFKGLAALRGDEIHGHLRKAHLNTVRNYLPELFDTLNPKFLSLLQRVYSLRYADAVPDGFNLKVFARETLAELDHTIHSCEFRVRLSRDGTPIETSFRSALAKRSPLLLADNHVLLNQPRSEFLAQPDVAYAILHRGSAGLLEAEFTVAESPKDGDFKRFGIRAVGAEEIEARTDNVRRLDASGPVA